MKKKELQKRTTPVSSSSLHAFEEHEVKEYERKRYRGIDQKIVHARETHILDTILERIAPRQGTALDIPCGYGRFSGMLRKRGWGPVNCDYSFSMVKRANESDGASEFSKKWGVVANAKRDLPFKDEAFFVLLCMRFWHHVHDTAERRSILRFFSRVTSDWVILSYYQINVLHRLQRRFRRKLTKSPTQIKMIPKSEFLSEVQGAGFECVGVIPLIPGIHAQHVALLKKIRT